MMRIARVAAAAMWVACGGMASGAEQVVWQIGKQDESYMEFAIARDYPAYRKRFAEPPVFEVGKSEAGRDWPFIHPGPLDTWAGRRVHPFKIRFALADVPKGVFTLRVALRDAHGAHPPRYAITLGGRTGQFALKAGGGDASLVNPKAGKPQHVELRVPASLFRKGGNEIVLACAEGSWVQYDAVTLSNDPSARVPRPGIKSVSARATPFYIRRGGKVRRAVDVTVGLTGPATDLVIRAEAGGERSEVAVKRLPSFGAVSQEVGVPDSAGPLRVTVTAIAGESSKSATITVKPQRKWRIYVAASAHTDIGYTDIQPKCVERHNENLDKAADLLEQFPDFRWNCEVAWQAENYLASRKGKRLETFLRLAREGKLGVQALYCNILTGLCHHEELCRLTYAAHAIHRQHGFPYKSAMINDVPTLVAAMPTMLAGAGIRYFSEGSNNTRAVTFNRLYGKSPCWWEGPDGSRVMMVFVPSYAYASRLGLDASLERARERILRSLRGYEARADYPYDAIFANGAVSDNCPLRPSLASVAKAWNERYEFPKIILCHNAEFFEHIEKHWGDKLPVVRGSGGTYWEDGAGSSARETALNRNAHETLVNAEKLLALCRRIRPGKAYPRKALADVWRNCMLYDEHTWGAHCSITKPESDFTKAQWKIKAQFAHDAHHQANALLAEGMQALAALVKTEERSLIVFNPSSWPRTDVVKLISRAGAGSRPANLVETSYAIVRDVPPCGYRVLKLDDATGARCEAVGDGKTIESRFYRVTFDPATGGIASILDKELKRELVDAKAPYRANQYLYVSGGKGTRIERGGGPPAKLTISTPQKASLRRLRIGGLGEMMVVGTSATMTPDVISEVCVWNDVKRIDITNTVRKKLTHDKEAAYFAFPFAADKPTFRYEEPNAVVNPATDMLPGACLEWFTVQHFVEVSSSDVAIAYATPDAPLVCFQDINRGKWPTKLPITNGHLYAYVINNYWFTNYLSGQGGEFIFRFSITSRPKASDVASARFGWGVSNPLIAVPAEANHNGPLRDKAASFVEVAEPNVLLIAAKQAETRDALVLRLWELTGKPTTAHVRLPLIRATKATLCNLVEVPHKPLDVHDGTVTVPIHGRGLATVTLE